jgi:hypothetical protein
MRYRPPDPRFFFNLIVIMFCNLESHLQLHEFLTACNFAPHSRVRRSLRAWSQACRSLDPSSNSHQPPAPSCSGSKSRCGAPALLLLFLLLFGSQRHQQFTEPVLCVPLCVACAACRVVLRACACGVTIVWPSVHVGPADRQDDFHSRA